MKKVKIKFIQNSLTIQNHKRIKIEIFYNITNTYILYYYGTMISIIQANDRLQEINQRLKKQNINMNCKIHINSDNNILLELFVDEICVSNIKCVSKTQKNINFILIHSNTPEEFRGKKYNLILRHVIVIICNHIKINENKIQEIHSFVLNIISENTIKKYFTYTKTEDLSYVINCSKKNVKKSLELLYPLLGLQIN